MKEISKEYAEAIFELACEAGEETAFMTALNTALEAFDQSPEFLALLSSPAIPLTERCEAIKTAFSGKLPEEVVSLISLMCEKGRISGFSECVKEFDRLLDAKNSVIEAKVISSVPLTDEEKAALTQKLEKKCKGKVELSCEVDPSIMGGLIIEMQDTVIDGSLRQRLRDMKDVMRHE